MTIIKNKKQMYELMFKGCLGNHLRAWPSAEELEQSVINGFDRQVGIRCGSGHARFFYPDQESREAVKIGKRLQSQGYSPIYQETNDAELIVMQGEVAELDHGWVLEYSTAKAYMRDALALERKMLFGIHARLLIKSAFTTADYDDLIYLFDTYPKAVIEFTTHSNCVGCTPGRNTLIWEVRNGY
ncbi:MAG: hypothetical protein ACXAEU_21000 [Candidatus Hodarchaeales archaeon]|jgi:hypothetical protein